MAMRMCALVAHASAEAMDFSQSLANRRQRPSQAKVRSTTHPEFQCEVQHPSTGVIPVG